MYEILPRFDLEKIQEAISKSGDSTLSLSALIDSLRLYNEKHYLRMDRHLTNSYFVDYLVSQMTLTPVLAKRPAEAEIEQPKSNKKRRKSSN